MIEVYGHLYHFKKVSLLDFVWMCHSLLMNNKINRLHERCLRIIYNDKILPFVDLFAKNGSVTIHTRNFHVLGTEIFKVHKNISTELMQGLCCVRQNHYNLRNSHNFTISSVSSVYHSSESKSNLGPRTWTLISGRLKDFNRIKIE